MTRQKLRIQLISTYYAPETTGNAPYAAGLAEGIAARGHEVSAVVGVPHYPGWAVQPATTWAPMEVRNGVRVEHVASYVPSRPTFLNRLSYELLFGCRFAARLDADADVVVLVSPSLFGSAVVLLRAHLLRKRPRTIVWVQDLYSAGVREVRGRRARLAGDLLARFEGALFSACDHVVVIHSRFRSYVVDTLGVANDRVAVIRNWTHVKEPVDIDREECRGRLGWGAADETTVVHAGNMGAKQGLENVVDAARIALERDLPIRFILIGDGNQRERLRDRAQGNTRVEFMESLPESAFMETLVAADILLVNERPGLNEAAVPSKLTTYFATGRPVLAATEPTSATADEIRASGAGWTVRSGDPAALVDAVLRVRDQLGDPAWANGPRYVRDHLSPAAALSSFESLMGGMTERPAHRPTGA